jgi:hypothetical protein
MSLGAAMPPLTRSWTLGVIYGPHGATSPVQSGPPPGLADAPKETLAAGLAEPQKDAPSNPAPGQGETPKPIELLLRPAERHDADLSGLTGQMFALGKPLLS